MSVRYPCRGSSIIVDINHWGGFARPTSRISSKIQVEACGNITPLGILCARGAPLEFESRCSGRVMSTNSLLAAHASNG